VQDPLHAKKRCTTWSKQIKTEGKKDLLPFCYVITGVVGVLVGEKGAGAMMKKKGNQDKREHEKKNDVMNRSRRIGEKKKRK